MKWSGIHLLTAPSQENVIFQIYPNSSDLNLQSCGWF